MPTNEELANAIRFLSMDAVQKANSGHPGMPMGMADIATVLWKNYLIHNPSNPHWPNRDRFILSNGHGSMLLYSLLHLTGYDVSIEDIQQFRQLHSKTPGHPEFGITPGVETTTGPLGQGLANAVGMAIAEAAMAAHFNRDGFHIVDHHTYVFMGDGCLMEGISHEACSLAGTLGLGKLIAVWDDNGISIDGSVAPWFSDDTAARFRAYGWHVIEDIDGHDQLAIDDAFSQAIDNVEQPTLICCKTTIGYGAPSLSGSEKSHGAPLGTEEIAKARKQLQWSHEAFVIPKAIQEAWDAREQGKTLEESWLSLFVEYKKEYATLANEFQRRLTKQLPNSWEQTIKEFIESTQVKSESIATRKAQLNVLNQLGQKLPELMGGSADLSGSNLTLFENARPITHENKNGQYIYYGVREFGMSAIMNGIALHGGFIPYGGTFLVFSDYARNAVRLAALMQQHVIFVYTHDSIGLGEDGPTHQPIEHLAMLRLTPGLSVWRPCDSVETTIAWQVAIENHTKPTCLALSRQTVDFQQRDEETINNIYRGGYILLDSATTPDLILIATGSEVQLAMGAAQQLANDNIRVRVVSMPSTDVFDQQDSTYREKVLPEKINKRIAIEAAASDYWYKYVGFDGKIIGLNQFGESAPAKEIYKALGLTSENIANTCKDYLK